MATKDSEVYIGNVGHSDPHSDPTAQLAIGLVSMGERRRQFPGSLNSDPDGSIEPSSHANTVPLIPKPSPLTQAEIDGRIHLAKIGLANGGNRAQYRAEVDTLRAARRRLQGGK